MEGLVLLGLLGAGYFINKEDKAIPSSQMKSQITQGSNNSVYDLNHFQDSKLKEINLVNQYNTIKNDPKQKLVQANDRDHMHKLHNENYIDSLSGSPISKSDFLINDQGIKVEPFFSGSGPRGINFEENTMLNRHQGGPHAFRGTKKEIGQFFQPNPEYSNPFGNTFSGPNADQSRYIPGNNKTNELPFQQEKVSHIDRNSEINRDIGMLHAERNKVDNIRTLTNQKESYGGKVLGGKGIDKRTEQGEVFKNLPDKDYLNTADRWLVTTGAIEAPLIRPTEDIKETNRQYLNDGKLGPAAPTIYKPEENRPMFKKSTNQQLNIGTNRNMTLENHALDDSHNRAGYFAYPNERETTSDNFFQMNLKTVYEEPTDRLQDNMKATIKETTLLENRNGFVGTKYTEVPTDRLHDDMKATVKETTNYEYSGNAGTNVPGSMANDQYLRADLNPNKEIIAQGRAPTLSNTKLSNGMDTINMDIKKIEDDYFNHRVNNGDKIYQEIPTDYTCEYTREKDTLNNYKLSNRLDPNMLDPFKENPYTQSLSSFAY